MTAEVGFCPFCGTRVLAADQVFCAACGKALMPPGTPPSASAAYQAPATTAAPYAAATAWTPAAPMPPVAGPAPFPGQPPLPQGTVWARDAAAPQAADGGLAAAWGGTASWGSLAQLVGVAAPVVIAWFVVTLAVVLPLSDSTRGSSGVLSGGSVGALGGSSMLSILALGVGVIGSMLAGLNFQLSASFAGSSGSGSIGLIPLLTLTLFAAITAIRSRHFARLTAPASLGAYLRPAVAAAALTAISLHVGALILTSPIGDALDSVTGGSSLFGAVHRGPSVGALLFVLFPVLLAGAVAGALAGGGWPLFMAWLSPRVPPIRLAQVSRLLPFAGYAVAGYAASVVVTSVVGLAVLLVVALINGGDVISLIRLLPASVVMIPNVASLLILAGTGAQVGFTIAGASLAQASTSSLWGAPLEWVLAGIVALLLPGLFTGVIARSRTLTATPAMIAFTGGVAALLALIVAVLAVPTIAANGQGLSSTASGSAKFVFDFGQAFVIGGVAIIGTALAGYRFGGSAAEALRERTVH